MNGRPAIVASACTFFVSGTLTNPLNGAHGHWATKAKARARWREKTAAMARVTLGRHGLRPVATSPKRVLMIAQTWNAMDTDGLQAAMKPIRDGLVDAGLIGSDGPKSGNVFVYAQRIDRKNRGAWVTVEALR